jgi:hypothetical protein
MAEAAFMVMEDSRAGQLGHHCSQSPMHAAWPKRERGNKQSNNAGERTGGVRKKNARQPKIYCENLPAGFLFNEGTRPLSSREDRGLT